MPCRVRRCRPDMQLGSAIIKYLSCLPPWARYMRGHHGGSSFRAVVVLSDRACGCGGQSVGELESHASHEEHSTCLARERERQWKVPRQQVPLTSSFARSVNATWCEKRCSGPSSSRREADPGLCLQWRRCPCRPASVKLCQWSSHACSCSQALHLGLGRHHRLHHPPDGMHRSPAVKRWKRDPSTETLRPRGPPSARCKQRGRALNKGRVIQSMRYPMQRWKHCNVEALS